MNLLLLEPHQLSDDGAATLEAETDAETLAHVIGVLGKRVGDTVRVGAIGGQIGTARIEGLTTHRARLQCTWERSPPPPHPVTLVLALPRPPMLRRILAAATSMGVKQIHLIHTARVDKSYWGTPSLAPDKIHQQLRLGLSQAVDTVLPAVACHRRFRPFVEDELDGIAGNGTRLVADLVPDASPAEAVAGATTLVVGPEGGLVDFERQRLAAAGFAAVHLGPRVLRVETAVVALLSRLG